MAYREEINPTNCPLCGRDMTIINKLKDFTIQACNTHGVFVVDTLTRDTWILEGFEKNMAPIKRKWYLVESHKPLTVVQYREMVKKANYKRLEEK
jgi:hypothetical protein